MSAEGTFGVEVSIPAEVELRYRAADEYGQVAEDLERIVDSKDRTERQRKLTEVVQLLARDNG